MKYVTMTPGGLKGATYEADSDMQAEAMAEADGYKVLDVVDFEDPSRHELVLVVEG